jgi:SAM-dependent methyltransferase
MDSIRDLFAKLSRIDIPKKSVLELELRFIIDARKKYDVFSKTYHLEETITLAKQLITKYKTNPCNVEQTINFIAQDKVKQMVFVRGEQQKDKQTFYKKTRIIEPIFFVHNSLPAYRLNVSYETPIEEFALKEATLARVRLRYTINLGDWRLDITLVKNVESFSNPAILKGAKSSMLFDIDLDTFVDKAPWKQADAIEFELEYIGESKNINFPMLSIGNTMFDGVLDNDSLQSASDATLQSSVYQNLIYQVAKYIKPKNADKFRSEFGMKQLSNQVIELDLNSYLKEVANSITDYYMTDKLDGKRAICYISDSGSYALTDKETTIPVKSNSTCVFDAELYDGNYYIFDIMVWEDEIITKQPFEERMKLFEKAAALSPLFKLKPFVKLTSNYAKQITSFKKEKKPYDIDGIILTPVSGEYDTMKVYKYKPVEHLTVDFLIKKCPSKLLGIRPYMPKPGRSNVYILFCGISKNVYMKLGMRLIKIDELFTGLDYRNLPRYFPIQFQPSDNAFAYLFWSDNDKLDGEVGEFSREGDEDGTCQWKLHRIREDRRVEVARGNYYGNNYKIAELVWMAYKKPLVIENLKSDDLSYFQEHDNQLQKSSRNFNSFVKATILEQFRDTDWVLDMASGKGQDLFRYGKNGTKHLVCVEIDQLALMELVARKHDFGNQQDRGSMNVQIHQLDINEDYKANIERLGSISIPNDGVDLIVCNFAFHYFLANKKSLTNVVNFISHYLKPGGRFVFTAFDGKEIIQLLNENDGDWTVKVGSEIQYSIRKQYSTNFIDLIGQKIEVLLPFSKSQYYQEYLVNIDYIAGEFEKHGMVLEVDQGFAEYLQDYKRVNSRNYATMTDNDKKYVSNYHYYCFYKKPPKTAGRARK